MPASTRNPSKHLRAHLALSVVVAASLSACTSTTKDSEVGAGRKQFLLLSEESVVNQAQAYYAQERSKAENKGTLVRSGRAYQRLRVILNKVLPATVAIRPDAANWKWELTLIDEPDTVNAHVLAGGKVTFYTGLIVRTSATDDELAAVMGHEIAHALREHTREKLSQSSALGAARSIGLTILGADAATRRAVQTTQQLALDLPFSRAMESEADALGVELAARAGYKPRGAVTFWEKMAKLSTGGPAFLSTHPASQDRRNALEALLPKVLPLYEQALKSPLKPFNIGTPPTVALGKASAVTVAQSTVINYAEFTKRLRSKKLQSLVGTEIRLNLKRGGDYGWKGFVEDTESLIFFSCPTQSKFEGGPLISKISKIRSNDLGVFVNLYRCGE